jgi:hypothetical protein
MAYIGQGIKQGTFKVLDTSGNTYNGSNTTFSLGTQVGSAAQLLVSHDGVIQKAGTDYTLATGGTQITFSTAPASGASIFITEISGAVGGTVTPSDTSVTADKLNSALLTGHTDIGANIADADLFLTDDGAGGTLRKTAASRLKTYVGAGAGAFSIANLDIDGGTDIGADIADADLFIIDDGAGGTNRKTAASRLKTYIGGGGLVFVGQASSTSEVSDLTLDNVFTSTYTNYLIVGEYTLINGSGPNCRFRFRSGGSSGSDLSGSEYNYHWIRFNADSDTTNNLRNTNDGVCDFSAPVSNDSARVSFRLTWTVYDPHDSSTRTTVSGHGKMTATDGNSAFMTGSCDYKGTGTAVTGIRFFANSDNVKNGHFRVYGIVDS